MYFGVIVQQNQQIVATLGTRGQPLAETQFGNYPEDLFVILVQIITADRIGLLPAIIPAKIIQFRFRCHVPNILGAGIGADH